MKTFRYAWTRTQRAGSLLSLLFGIGVFTDAAAAPINCTATRIDVEETICRRPELMTLDKNISDKLDAIKRACPSQRALLVQEQKFWLRERSDCRNVEGVFERPDGLASCLAQRMGDRMRRLESAGLDCDPDRLRGGYRFVDPRYLRLYSAHYIGKPVAVHGSIALESCDKPGAAPTVAAVVGKTRRERFPARFSAMPDAQKDFLCAQSPAAHWRGIVKRDEGGGAYLFMDHVLGAKLP